MRGPDEGVRRAPQDRYYSSADGLTLYYRDYPGDGPTAVLCLPGLTRNSRDFAALAAKLSPRARVLTPDLRGRGLSARDPQWRNYHPRVYLEDIERLLAAAGLERVAVIGTSLGGILGMLLAAERPHRVAGLVLNDVGPEFDGKGLARIAANTGRKPPVRTWEEAAEQCREYSAHALPDFLASDWDAYARRIYREDEQGVPVLDMDPQIGEAMRSSSGRGAPDLWHLWARLGAVPALVLRGELSDFLAAATVERMTREKPDLRSVTVPNRGHTPTLEEPVCVDAIMTFLDGLAARR